MPPAPYPDPEKLEEYATLLAWRFIAEQEGGGRVHTNPGDPGGTTKWGFAQRFNPGIDVTTLTFSTAYDLFVTHYWVPLRGSSLPFPIALALVDYAFNKGADDAVPRLQRRVGSAVDGRMGPRTVHAVQTRYSHAPRRLLDDYLSDRILDYADSPRFREQRGWIVRCFALRGYVEKYI